MEFKNSLSILFSNTGYVFKIMVWLLLSLLLAGAVGVGILLPIWNKLAATTDVMTYVATIESSLKEVWNGSLNLRVAANDIVPAIVGAFKAMSANGGATAGFAIGIVFVYALYCFLRGLSFLSIADIINNLMASNMRFGFASNMALNLRRSVRFSLSKLAISLPLDVAFFAILLACSLVFFMLIGVFTLPIVLVLTVTFCSFRAVFFGGWLPRVLYHPEERMFPAFSRSLVYVKHNFFGLLKAFVLIFSITYMLTILLVFPTGGLIALVLPPIYYFLMRAAELIGYYKAKGMSFYTDGSTVVNTVDFGFRSDNQERDAARDSGLSEIEDEER